MMIGKAKENQNDDRLDDGDVCDSTESTYVSERSTKPIGLVS